ncbi:MAG: DNA polymerase/3'-5' exonuclease PolX [Phycisphaerae bacterium]
MINTALAAVFARIADLLEIDGADRFRINSYRRASRTLLDTAEDVATLAAEGALTTLPGIGKGTADRIQQYLDTGRIAVLDELEAKLPKGLPQLLAIPGMGPKKVALVYDRLDVKSINDLKRAIESGKLAELPGLGPASVEKIAEGIAFLERSAGRTPLGVAEPLATQFAQKLAAVRGVKRVEVAGSLRRGAETIGDIDILCDAANREEVVKQFTEFDGVQRILAKGATKGSITVALEGGRELQIDLRVVPRESFGAALQYFTGSKEHNVRLREIAVRRKLRLNEYGLFDADTMVAGRREADVYDKLGLPLIPPELREDRGEFESGAFGKELLKSDDIRGDLHMHTVASDGTCTIEELAEGAKARGYDYIGICDHSRSATIANGLSIQRMEKHIRSIRAANKAIPGITVLVGCEVDILPNGALDYPGELLAQCDVVVASIHSAMGRGGSGKLSPTERTIAACENPYVTIIGHPTGRLIHKREPMDIDMTAVIEAAKRTRTILEVNAHWQRLDLKDLHVRQAVSAGVAIAVNTDAHRVEGLDQIRYGVLTARRGGATKKDVVNSMGIGALRRRLAAKRK